MTVLSQLHGVPAPAKLNLFLHVVGRREDGYHLLQSAFMLLDWWDRLHFDLREDGQLRRIDLTEPLPEYDLCLKAARLLKNESQTRWGATIQVEKYLPSQAGMGGGSSDAASTLLALNRLWGLHWPLSRLLPLGLQLGADVPFFLGGRPAFVEGIGERFTPVKLPMSDWVVLKPPAGLETARIFQDPGLKRDTSPATIADFAARPYAFGRNDLQAVASRLCPPVDQALRWLTQHGLQPKMTGSGSAVFAQLPLSVRLPAPPDGWLLRRCRNLEIHPLAGWVSCDVEGVGLKNRVPV
jgi:4-diphosphocytidyl-2-C-methyl-D-erythritol kinase